MKQNLIGCDRSLDYKYTKLAILLADGTDKKALFTYCWVVTSGNM